MSVLLENEWEAAVAPVTAQAKAKGAAKKKVEDDDDTDIEEEVAPPKKGTSKKSADDDDDDLEDDAGAGEDANEWDPDFDEFDVPKSKGGKADKEEEEEDFKVEEEEDFKDMDLFNESGFDDDEDDF